MALDGTSSNQLQDDVVIHIDEPQAPATDAAVDAQNTIPTGIVAAAQQRVQQLLDNSYVKKAIEALSKPSIRRMVAAGIYAPVGMLATGVPFGVFNLIGTFVISTGIYTAAEWAGIRAARLARNANAEYDFTGTLVQAGSDFVEYAGDKIRTTFKRGRDELNQPVEENSSDYPSSSSSSSFPSSSSSSSSSSSFEVIEVSDEDQPEGKLQRTIDGENVDVHGETNLFDQLEAAFSASNAQSNVAAVEQEQVQVFVPAIVVVTDEVQNAPSSPVRFSSVVLAEEQAQASDLTDDLNDAPQTPELPADFLAARAEIEAEEAQAQVSTPVEDDVPAAPAPAARRGRPRGRGRRR